MIIERAACEGEGVSRVTADGRPLLTMGQRHLMLGLLAGRGGNDILAGAHYGDDYLVRDAPGGAVIGRWFVERYGWKRFWPPGATISRIERLMRAFHSRACGAQAALKEMSAALVADGSLPHREVSRGHAKTSQALVCGMNRHGTLIEYAVQADGGYCAVPRQRAVERSATGDAYAKAAGRAHDVWSQHHRFTGIFDDLVLGRLLADGRGVGIHRVVVEGRGYWFRMFHRQDKHVSEFAVESLDEHGTVEITETSI